MWVHIDVQVRLQRRRHSQNSCLGLAESCIVNLKTFLESLSKFSAVRKSTFLVWYLWNLLSNCLPHYPANLYLPIFDLITAQRQSNTPWGSRVVLLPDASRGVIALAKHVLKACHTRKNMLTLVVRFLFRWSFYVLPVSAPNSSHNIKLQRTRKFRHSNLI